ncbi:conserved hypothetical protein [Crocosphaera subtropica ATCC 51142]|uniref:Uncharacterized protein n=1 Tax=Crocosphaera subtropica (strain ATCC 51142 / BH68) TaxID=43989 RepID=B1WVQ4_CROS5|nr:hypothetical protein [Crocosphaera subtropica]ACB50641.1 conserved hypothetical protein [Crocosphaera subtropica ATCC 51142]
MLLFVILFNLVITCINCYLAVKLWQLYGSLKQITYQLTNIEQQMNELFSLAPDLMLKGQQGTVQLRQFYQKFLVQLAIAQRVFETVKLLWKVWYRVSNSRLLSKKI